MATYQYFADQQLRQNLYKNSIVVGLSYIHDIVDDVIWYVTFNYCYLFQSGSNLQSGKGILLSMILVAAFLMRAIQGEI